MDNIIYLCRRAIEGILGLFDLLPPALSLTLVGIVTGVIMLLVVGWTTPQKWVEISRNRMVSAVYETRLFLDSPKRVLIAQGRLAVWSVAYVATMLPAFVIIALPLGLLYLHLDVRYGVQPLALHQPLVLKAALGDGVSPDAFKVGPLPAGLTTTSPAVFSPGDNSVYLRMQAAKPGTFTIPLETAGQKTDKLMVVGVGQPEPKRSSGWDLLYSMGSEAPLAPQSRLRSVEFFHEDRTDTWLAMPWWLLWLLIATGAALGLKRPLGVTL